MATAHKRKKQPEIVRSKLIECAVRIIVEQGPNAVTIQAVADAAGVTKGGLLHHFQDKKQLSNAVSKYLLSQMDAEINLLMSQDSVEYGRFTRAYINAISQDLASAQSEQWIALAIYSITESESKNMWNEWIKEKQRLYYDTDSDKMLQVLRYAADGIWFEALLGDGYQSGHSNLISCLVKMTYNLEVDFFIDSIKK
ncbi:TetR family transcriptional regulator [Pseudodesulfovibrio sp. F-1]|uniref:TetR family transcriptional regulator n=1 Tax=Pseudodesulfovibrio alkaliphilus TaxID=2661613 RepID=A0A7K1KQC5_9BACT|nr:TetR/AcrR family transcriptional regulator [Pseudodesulfovibrio alkaliphilus]MUM78298.1 TetR family transcriptional regulator [Pseudodesulfovibrio alkaliphilus]